MTWHEAFVILKHAPQKSDFMNTRTGMQMREVGTTELLLQSLINQIQGLTYGLGGGKGPKPKPVDLTGKIDEENRQDVGEGVSIEEMRERLGLSK